MRVPSRVLEISAAGDFSGSGLLPIHTDSMRSPVTRLCSPRAMVSTSGNSGIRLHYLRSLCAGGWCCIPKTERLLIRKLNTNYSVLNTDCLLLKCSGDHAGLVSTGCGALPRRFSAAAYL